MRNEILPGMEDPGTIFSPCGNYRYRLERKFAEVDSAVLLRWILMNPSLADTFELDNTLKIVAELTRAWGYFGFVVLNLKAFVSPYPLEVEIVFVAELRDFTRQSITRTAFSLPFQGNCGLKAA